MKTNQIQMQSNPQPKAKPLWTKLAALAVAVLPLLSAQAGDITWGITNVSTSANWSAGGSWVGGVVPTALDNAIFLSTNPVNPTILVDVSTNVQNYTITRAGVYGSTVAADTVGFTNTIAAGQTLSVLGPNGFLIQHAPLTNGLGTKMKDLFTFTGNTLLVSNPAARFILNSGEGIGNSSSTFDAITMSGLTNLTVSVSLFGAANSKLAGGPLLGDQSIQAVLAKTNIITATYTNDFTQLDFTNSVEIARMENAGVSTSFAQNDMLELGYSNVFNCDSFGVGRGNAAAASANMTLANLSANGKLNGGFSVSFANINSAAPVSSATFRNVDKVSRMSLLALGVDSGTSLTNNRNNGILYLTGGKVDMKVDQIWLGRNRTNAVGNTDMGGFAFDNGTVDANTIIAGNMAYTNTAYCGGFILVGTNGVLKVNNYLELGHSPADTNAFLGFINQTAGQLQITNGGVVRASQINVGAYSTNDTITINAGGTLDVTNTVASAAKMLTTLTSAGGGLTLHLNGANTLVYVTNLNSTVNSPINIASFTGITTFPATISIIKYVNPTGVNFSKGTMPPGYNAVVQNNAGNSSIDIVFSPGGSKNLLWKGYVDNNWDLTTANWYDQTTGLHTNFATGDNVAFDDTSSQANINVSASLYPSQAAGGMTMTNNTLDYTFTTSSGGQILGSSSFTKVGTKSLTVDLYTEFGASVKQGALTNTVNGTISSATISAGASLVNNGNMLAGLVCAGTVNNSGVIPGTLAVQSSGIVTNTGSINGSLSMQINTILYNAGTLGNIGSLTAPTNSIIINAGTINGTALIINGLLEDTGAGTINMNTTLTIGNGANFIPGGNGIGTTTVQEYPSGAAQPAGRVLFSTGSTNFFKVDITAGQNTKLLSRVMTFGPNQAAKAFNGGTLAISNVGTTAYAAGQTFQLFYYEDGVHNIIDAGLNTTNSYPVINPAAPGTGLAWDLSQILTGVIGIIAVPTTPTNVTQVSTYTIYNNYNILSYATNTTTMVITTNYSTNNIVVSEMSWPATYIGWRLQQLQTTLNTGLAATNWTEVFAGRFNNDVILTNGITTDPTANGGAIFYRMVYP